MLRWCKDHQCRPPVECDLSSSCDRAVDNLASVAGFLNMKKDRRALEVMQTVIASHLNMSSIGKQ